MNQELLMKNFSKKGYIVRFFENQIEVIHYLQAEMNKEIIGYGDSVTLRQIGLDVLGENNILIGDWYNPSKDTLKLSRQANVYFTSANGVSETGEIVNIDGAGNRLAMMSYGPKKLFVIVGKNKIEPSLEKAIYRARNIAAPLNAKRLNINTPCVKTDKCMDCNSSERICRGTLVLERPMMGMDVEVIFINEDLGY